MLKLKGRFYSLFFLLVILFTSSCNKKEEVNVVSLREPYLQYVSSDSLAVRWFSSSSIESPSVEWNNTYYHSKAIKHKHGFFYESIVPVTDKENEYYIVGNGIIIGNKYITNVLSDSSRELNFFAVGDIGQPVSKGGFSHLLNQLIKSIDSLQFGVFLGDIVYPNGRSQDYDSNFFTPLSQSLSSIVTVPILGNHDYMSDVESNYFQEWKKVGNGHYFSITKNNTLFVFLDSKDGGFYEYDKQKDWLTQTLKDAQGKYDWIIVSLHHNGITASYKSEYSRVVSLYPIFEKYKVDLVLNGHAHTYERLNPMDGQGNPMISNSSTFYNSVVMNKSFISITTGAGGKLNTDYHINTSDEKYKQHVAKAVNSGHLTTFKILDKRLECKVYNLDKELIDSFVIDKSL